MFKPFKAVDLCRQSIARKVSFGILVISLIKNIYVPFMYTKSDCNEYGLLRNKSIILDISEFVFSMALPYIIIFIINISLICYLTGSIFRNKDSCETFPIQLYNSPKALRHNHYKNANNLSLDGNRTQEPMYRHGSYNKEQRKQKKLTISLFCTLLMLLICYLPSFVLEKSLFELIFSDFKNPDLVYRFKLLGLRISQVLICLNCTANVVIYCISNEKYFDCMMLLFRKRKFPGQSSFELESFSMKKRSSNLSASHLQKGSIV